MNENMVMNIAHQFVEKKKIINNEIDLSTNKCLINVKQVSNIEENNNYDNVSIPDSQIDRFKRIRTESFDKVDKNKILNMLNTPPSSQND